MSNSRQQSESGGLLQLEDYIVRLYKVGGLPLVLIGIGAANLFVPYGDIGETKQLVVTIMLFVAAVLIWSASAYVEARRSIIEIEIVAKQDEIVLTTFCHLAREEVSDALKDKSKTLKEILSELGVRRVAEGLEGGQEHGS